MADIKFPENHPVHNPDIAVAVHRRFKSFMQLEASSGIILVIMAIVAVIWANLNYYQYEAFFMKPLSQFFGLEKPFTLGHHGHKMIVFDLTLKDFINDVLMVIFFFVVGAEIKREMVLGGLSSFSKASLPVAAAIGGMIVPAGFYLIFHHDTQYTAGWGVPMATDIAFAVGILSLLGNRVTPQIKILLLAIAIADDLGAILVIAVGYTAHLNLAALLYGGLVMGLILILRKIGVRRIWVYVILGVFLWLCIFESGVHATVAGVILGFMTPTTPHQGEDTFIEHASHWLQEFEQAHAQDKDAHHKTEILNELDWARQHAVAPLFTLESILAPWSAFVIIPLFALANAGVVIDFGQLSAESEMSMVALGIAIGLVVGKPIGVLLFSWIAVKLKISSMPENSSWGEIFGLGLLAGIGFTMAIFVGELAFKGNTSAALPIAKIGIMTASIVAAVLGLLFLRFATKDHTHDPPGMND